MADLSIFLQKKDSLPLLTLIPFIELRQKKMNGLLEKRVFGVVSISEMPKNIRVFNSYFVNKIKNIRAANAFKKSRLVVQVYNNYDKILIFT